MHQISSCIDMSSVDTWNMDTWSMDTFSCTEHESSSHGLASVDCGVDFATVDPCTEPDAEEYEPNDSVKTVCYEDGKKERRKETVRLN